MSAHPSSFMVAGVGFDPTRDPAPPGAGTPPKGPGRAYTRHPMALCVSLVLETTRAPQGPPARHGNQSCSFRRGKIAARATVHKSALPSDRSTSWASSEQWSWLLPLGKTAAIPASLRVLASACADRLHHAYPSDPEAAGARDFRLARGRGESRRRAANRRRSAEGGGNEEDGGSFLRRAGVTCRGHVGLCRVRVGAVAGASGRLGGLDFGYREGERLLNEKGL